MGGGPRTKESNLNEMTCFGGVKLGELGFSVPSPRRHIHLEGPGLRVCTPEDVSGQEEPTAGGKRIGAGRTGDLVQSFADSKRVYSSNVKRPILNSCRALEVDSLKGISYASADDAILDERAS